LSDRLFAAVKGLDDPKSDADYGYIDLLPETGECPLLDEQLCAVHKELGEYQLSNSCFSYPRNVLNSGGIVQQTLTLSCPQAARLALLADDAFEIVEREIAVRPSAIEQLLPRCGMSLE